MNAAGDFAQFNTLIRFLKRQICCLHFSQHKTGEFDEWNACQGKANPKSRKHSLASILVVNVFSTANEETRFRNRKRKASIHCACSIFRAMSRRWLTRYERFMIFPQFIKNWSKSEKSKNWNSYNSPHFNDFFGATAWKSPSSRWPRAGSFMLINSFIFFWKIFRTTLKSDFWYLLRFEIKIEFFRRYLLIQILFQIQAKFVTVFYHLSWLKDYAEPLSDYKSTFFVQQAKYILLADVPLSSMMGN